MLSKALIIILLFLAGFQLSCSKISEAQTRQESNNYAAIERASSIVKIKVEVNIDSLVIDDSRIEAVLTQPAPKVWLILHCQEKSGDCNQSTSSAKILLDEQIIEQYWKQSLYFKYRYLVEKFPNANEEYQESDKFSVITNQSLTALKGFYINSPSGNRCLSNNEAEEIMKSVNTATMSIIKKLKVASSENT